MFKGRYAVAGWYTNWLPGCSVLPLVEVSGVEKAFPFGGYVEFDEQGNMRGELVDEHGVAKIQGELDGEEIRFRKMYGAKGEAIHYQLTKSGIHYFSGSYRFKEEQETESGRVRLELLMCTIGEEVRT